MKITRSEGVPSLKINGDLELEPFVHHLLVYCLDAQRPQTLHIFTPFLLCWADRCPRVNEALHELKPPKNKDSFRRNLPT